MSKYTVEYIEKLLGQQNGKGQSQSGNATQSSSQANAPQGRYTTDYIQRVLDAGTPARKAEAIAEKARQGEWTGFGVNDPDENADVAQIAQKALDGMTGNDRAALLDVEEKKDITWLDALKEGFSKPFPVLDGLAQAREEAASRKEIAQEIARQTGANADTLLELANRIRNEKKTQQTAQEAQQLGQEHPVLASAGSVVGNVLGAIPAAQDYTAQYIEKLFGGGEIDPNSPLQMMRQGAQGIRGEVGANIEKGVTDATGSQLAGNALSKVYGSGMSYADSIANYFLTGGAAGFAGLLTGLGSAADTVTSAKEKGASDAQALAIGTAAGIFEGLFEKYSLGNLQAMQGVEAKTLKGAALNILKNMGVEGGSEGATEIANMVTDAIVMGDLSDYELAKQQYAAQGMDEDAAGKQAFADMAMRALSATAGGALMGGISGGVSTVSNAVQNRPSAQLSSAADQVRQGGALTPQQIAAANRAAQKLDAVGSEAWYDVNMAKYADGLTNAAGIENAIAEEAPSVQPVGRQAIEPYGPNTVGAAEANPNSFSHMQNEYGTIKPGENPARVVDVPKSTDGKDKVSLYARTLMEAKATPESLIPEYEQYVADGLFSHNVKTDKAAMDSAVRTIKDKGYAGALAQWSDVVEGRRSATKEDTTLAQLLYTEAAKAGDTKGAMRLAAEIAVEGTRAGQVEQSMRLLKKMTPEGNLYYVQKSVDRLQHDLENGVSIRIGVDAKTLKAFKAGDKKLTIPEDLAANLLNAKNEKEITEASEAIWQNVGQQLPANWVEKWNAWRYFAMLGNARTHIANIAGNAVFWPARQLKNMTGSVLETVFVHDTSQRTKAVLNPLAAADKERMSFAKSDFDDNMRSVMMGSGKLNPTNVIRESRDTFRTKPLNALVKGNGKALDFEDAIFSGNAYADSMAGYMKARKLTAADMTGHTLEQARSYALDQAKKATYRDDSAIASAINKFSKKNAATQIIVGGAAPFTKTPINIVKRGIEYSPVGISKALTYDARKVMKNEMTASELIEDLSAGLTGTGIMALGTYFASKGILTGGNKENKKEEQFDELQGGQNYALKLGDKSYTINWMAPVALPLFVGTELWNAYNKDGTASLTRVLDALTSISEPMVNLTMLNGINNAIKTAGRSKTPFTDIISSTAAGYFGQAVPTLGGQIARSIDNTRRTTFTQAGGPLAVESKTLQKLGNKIPGVSQKNAPFVDQWGRTQQNAEGNLAQRLAYNMLSPGFYFTNKSTQVDNVLNELYQKTGDQRALPKFANKTQTVGDEKNRYEKKLTKDEYTKFAQDSGKKAYDLLDVLVPGYKNLTDEQSVSATEKAYEVATDLAKNTALGSPLTQTTKNILDAADKYSKDENKNVGIAEIIKANVIIRDIRSDEYPNGKPISGSAKRKKVQALVDSGYSRTDAMKLYDLLNN